jgi:hypothetical protein
MSTGRRRMKQELNLLNRNTRQNRELYKQKRKEAYKLRRRKKRKKINKKNKNIQKQNNKKKKKKLYRSVKELRAEFKLKNI